MNKVLKFAQAGRIVQRGHIEEVTFPYEIIDENFLGLPEEQSKWEKKYLTVQLSDTLKACWNGNLPAPLSADEIKKVMFEYGFRELTRKAQEGELPEESEHLLHAKDEKTPHVLEFMPARLETPDGAVKRLEVKRIIGFK